MYLNNKILVGKNDKNDATLLLDKANRHGLITGASGSGKTITLKVLAESFSDAGVPVFLIDVKGDLAGMPIAGTNNENIASRIEKLKLEDFNLKGYPTTFFDVYGKNGHPVRLSISEVSTRMLAKVLNLTSTQEGVLAIIFKIASDENIKLDTINDLKQLLTYVGEKRNELTLTYGNITTQSIGAIQRSLLSLGEEDGNILFGEPSIDVKDFIHFDNESGNGFINVLDATTLFNHPTLYATVVISILNKLYNTLPEVGDTDKPKIVFFFDEAHLVFSEMSEPLMKQFIQMVKLIRSKGIGLYFITQSPGDIDDEILAQLGNRIQHVLRSYTKTDEKVIKAAANSYRENPEFDTIEAIKTLGTGEAIISFLNEKGEPSIVDRFTILPPQSQMGTLDSVKRKEIIKNSWLYNKYNLFTPSNNVNSNSNNQQQTSGFAAPKVSMSQFTKQQTETQVQPQVTKKEVKTNSSASKKANRIEKKVMTRVENKLINKFVNKIFK